MPGDLMTMVSKLAAIASASSWNSGTSILFVRNDNPCSDAHSPPSTFDRNTSCIALLRDIAKNDDKFVGQISETHRRVFHILQA
jgi:hypothetical protein